MIRPVLSLMSLDAGCRSTAKRYELHLGTINALLQRSRPAVVQGVPATKPLCSIPSLGSSYIDRAIYSQPMKRQQIDNMSSSPSPGRGDGRPVWGLGARPSQPISINPSGVHLGGASHHSSIRASRVSEHRGSAVSHQEREGVATLALVIELVLRDLPAFLMMCLLVAACLFSPSHRACLHPYRCLSALRPCPPSRCRHPASMGLHPLITHLHHL